MDKGLKIFLVFLAFLLVVGIILQSTLPEPINQAATYNLDDKIPLGLYVLSEETDNLYKGTEIERWPYTLYEYFHGEPDTESTEEEFFAYEVSDEDDTSDEKLSDSLCENLNDTIYTEDYRYDVNISLLYINKSFEFDAESVKVLFKVVKQGNSALISSLDFPDYFLDSLHLYTIQSEKFSDFENMIPVYDESLPVISGDWPYSGVYFDTDSLSDYQILGYTCDEDGNWKPNYVKIRVGKGYLYLHTEPAIFSNFSLLEGENYRQVEYILSQIRSEYVLWLTKDQTGGPVSDSALRYIKSQPPLRLAWNLMIAGFLLLMIFNAKRWQRAVPIIPPNSNTTEEFVKTISNLYQQEGSVRDIMDKKIIFFLERIRSRYLIPTEILDEHFIQKLHHKTQCSLKDAERVVFLIHKHRDSDYTCTHDDLRRLSKAMEAIG